MEEATSTELVSAPQSNRELVEYGKPLDDDAYQIERLRIPVIPFDAEQAKIVASLWKLGPT
jgi:hypothetical protein